MFSNVNNILDNDKAQVCRLCLAKEENLIYIFDPEGYQGFRLSEIIKELLQLEVSKEDGLPWTICKGCFGKVKDFKAFKTTCIHAKISFLTMIANRSLVSSLVHKLPSPPSQEAMKIIQNRPSSRVNRKESDEVEVVEIVKEESPVTSADEDPLAEVSVSPKEEERGHRGKSCFTPRPPSQPSFEPTKTILKKASSQTSRKYYDEVEVVEILKEETPVFSADEDPPWVVTVMREKRDRGHREKANVKEEVTSSESLSEAENSSEENPLESESSNDSVSNVVSSSHEMEDLSCLVPRPQSQPSWEPTETILKRATRKTSRNDYDEVEVVEIVKEETPVLSADEDPPREVTVSRREGDWGQGEMANVKEEVTSKESMSEVENSCKENPHKSDSSNGNVSNVVSSPLEMEDLVVGCSMAGGSPKMWEEIVSDVGDDREKNITEEFERNASLSGLSGEHTLINIKKFNNKKGKSLKSGDYITNAIKFSGMMPSELRRWDSHNKQFGACTELICDYCGATYTDKNKIATHIRDHFSLNMPSTSAKPEHSSLMCLESRFTGIESSKPLKCEMFGKEFNLKRLLRSQFLEHRDIKPFKCETCGKKFKRKTYLTKHLVRHSDLRPYKCDTCGKGFTEKTTLVRHSVIHSGLRPFKCDTCGKGFTHKCNLVQHSVIHSGLRPFKCDTCGKGFKYKCNLVQHSVIHSNLRPFKCDTCGKGFNHRFCLVKHSVLHSSLRPFKCDTCKKGFTQESSLAKHLLVHSDLRPFKCDTCGMGFTLKSILVNHLVIHSGLRPFKCYTCGKGFTQKSNLVEHLLVHSGLRPFKCGTCGKGFTRRSTLVKHSVIHS